MGRAKAPKDETPRQKFIRTVNPRIKKIENDFSLLGKMGRQRSQFEFQQEDVDTILAHLKSKFEDLEYQLAGDENQQEPGLIIE